MTTPHTPVRSARRASSALAAVVLRRPRGARAGRQWPPARLTGAVGSFLRSLRTRRPETRGTYERALQEFLRWSGRRKHLRLTVGEIKAYKRHLTNRRGLSDVSVSTYLTAVRLLCGYLQRTGSIPGNPALEVAGNSRPRTHARKALSVANATRLLGLLRADSERGLRDAAVIRLMLRCALSDAEIVRLNLGDLSRDAEPWTLAVQGKGKSTKDASVQLPGDVSAAFAAYLWHRSGATEREPLFLSAGNSSRGRRMTTRAVRDRVNEYLELAGIRTERNRQRVTPRSLRHTAALLMAAEGATPDDIRKRLRLGTLQTVHVYLQAPRHRALVGPSPVWPAPRNPPRNRLSHHRPSHHNTPGNRSGN